MTPAFLTSTVVRELSADLWELFEPLDYDSALLGRVTVPAGFITDFYSIPRWLPITYALLSHTRKGPAVLHDYYYQTHGVERGTADALLLEAMEAIGTGWVKRRMIYAGVRAGGWVAWGHHRERASVLNPIWTAEGWPEPALSPVKEELLRRVRSTPSQSS